MSILTITRTANDFAGIAGACARWNCIICYSDRRRTHNQYGNGG